MPMTFLPHRKHIYRPPRHVTDIFYMPMTFLPHRKHIYSPPWPVTEISLPFYTPTTFLPHRKHTYRRLGPVTGIALLLTYLIVFCDVTQYRRAQKCHNFGGMAPKIPFTRLRYNQIDNCISGALRHDDMREWRYSSTISHSTLRRGEGSASGPCLFTFIDTTPPPHTHYPLYWRLGDEP
jgi:hypothetical protein